MTDPTLPSTRPSGDTFEAVVGRRIGRRETLRGAFALGVLAVVPQAVDACNPTPTPTPNPGPTPPTTTPPPAGSGPTPQPLTFATVTADATDVLTVPLGYQADVVIAWGDPLFAGDGPFVVGSLTAADQERRVGFNADFLQFLPLPAWGTRTYSRALLWNNHEYTDAAMMFPDLDPETYPTREQADIEIAAHGGTVVELRRSGHSWVPVVGSRYNRRITGTTPMRISGPAAADPRVGTATTGMLNNCGGGITPWGTILTAEENFNQYFANNDLVADEATRAAHARYGIGNGASERGWELHHPRFDLAVTPDEPFTFGWVVEIDPYDPGSTPTKRTALGRLKHEAATTVLTADGRVAVYSGDDERFECLYKFVSDGVVDLEDRVANADLLDTGVLHAAVFHDDGTGEWLPLVPTPQLAAAGFTTQAEILLRTRDAAAAVGATKMDRPEDVEASPVTGKVYMACTNNTQRGTDGRPGVDAANPRAVNTYGHVIEITEDGGDAASTTFTWEILLLCGNPADPSTYFAGFDKTRVSPISCPDNVSFDSSGNLWIATDGAPGTWGGQFSPSPNDAVHAVPVEGSRRGELRQFLSGVVDCEVASLLVADDDRVLFVSIQHPGEGSTLAEPSSTWPGPFPRPAVAAVTSRRGGRVGR